MSALQIKNELLRLLTETDDVQLLEQVRVYFQKLKKDPSSFKGEESKLTIKSLNARIEKAENQDGTSYEIFKKKYGI